MMIKKITEYLIDMLPLLRVKFTPSPPTCHGLNGASIPCQLIEVYISVCKGVPAIDLYLTPFYDSVLAYSFQAYVAQLVLSKLHSLAMDG